MISRNLFLTQRVYQVKVRYICTFLNIGAKQVGKNVFFIWEEEERKGPYDLALLGNCNHTIQSYVSFTYYAGFFAGGYKIIPEHYTQYRQPHTYKPLSSDPFEIPVPRLYYRV